MKLDNIDFKTLIAQAKQSEDGFAQFLRTIQPYIIDKATYLLGSEVEAEDIFQNISLKLYRNLDNLNPDYFMLYLKRTVTNACIDVLKKKNIKTGDDYEAREVEIGAIPGWEIPDDNYSGIDLTVEYRQRIIKEVLDTLPYNQKQVIIMRYMDELKLKDIAQQLDINENTVKSRLNLAYKKIKEEVLRIQERDDIKLYSYSPFVYFLLLLRGNFNYPNDYLINKVIRQLPDNANFIGNALPAESAPVAGAAGKAVATNTAIESATGNAVASGVAKASTAISSKVIAGALAGTLAVGGIGYGVSRLLNNNISVDVNNFAHLKIVEQGHADYKTETYECNFVGDVGNYNQLEDFESLISTGKCLLYDEDTNNFSTDNFVFSDDKSELYYHDSDGERSVELKYDPSAGLYYFYHNVKYDNYYPDDDKKYLDNRLLDTLAVHTGRYMFSDLEGIVDIEYDSDEMKISYKDEYDDYWLIMTNHINDHVTENTLYNFYNEITSKKRGYFNDDGLIEYQIDSDPEDSNINTLVHYTYDLNNENVNDENQVIEQEDENVTVDDNSNDTAIGSVVASIYASDNSRDITIEEYNSYKINIREGYSTSARKVGVTEPRYGYNVYDIKENEGYTWYRISSPEHVERWIANNGEWLSYSAGLHLPAYDDRRLDPMLVNTVVGNKGSRKIGPYQLSYGKYCTDFYDNVYIEFIDDETVHVYSPNYGIDKDYSYTVKYLTSEYIRSPENGTIIINKGDDYFDFDTFELTDNNQLSSDWIDFYYDALPGQYESIYRD